MFMDLDVYSSTRGYTYTVIRNYGMITYTRSFTSVPSSAYVRVLRYVYIILLPGKLPDGVSITLYAVM
jgi:hypothetical protein